MSLGDELVGFLGESPIADGAHVLGWHVELAEGDVVRLGMRDGRLGGPYDAPSVATRLGGSVELRWSDGLVTRGRLGRAALVDLPSQLVAWRAEAYSIRLFAPPAPPAACPDVLTVDLLVAALVAGRPDDLIDGVVGVARSLRERGIESADVSVTAGAARRRVVSSAGFDVGWQETTYGLEISADDLHGASYASRRLPRDDELGRLVVDAAETVAALRVADVIPDATRGVLYAPSVVEALLGRFLAPNLDGRAVVRGRSPFSPDDFATGRSVMGADLDLLVDTTLPFELATAPCSSEGVPAGRVVLIRAGRLVTPLLDRERAARLERPPTPAPRGRPSLMLETSDAASDAAISPDVAVELLGDGVVVRSAIGLHTQNARRGEYTVVVPAAQVVRGGRLGGRASVRVRGNVFTLLASAGTRLVRYPGSVTPGLLALGAVDVMPA
ncbi:MAG: metallopeptidase TldD-related protein [Chloroflexota bacterium]|nr:metallopeptidase TldD-related protein [Chloroflexota bacterium]